MKTTHIPDDPVVWVGSDEETPRVLGKDFTWIKKLGKDGIKFVGKEDSFSIPAQCRITRSTCGAGDSFISALVYARCRGDSWRQACDFASVVAAIQVEREWISPITLSDVEEWKSSFGL